ncbi:MAG: hypothetical protein Q7J67_03335 [bacterium]|nr:hypothetical protein [bacterium]
MKRYLTGVDWIIHTINHINKKETGVGNMFQVVLQLKGTLDETTLRECLNKFIKKFPVVNGRPMRNYNLAPYWKIYSNNKMLSPNIRTYRLDDNATFSKVLFTLEQGVNMPFNSIKEHLAFHLVHTGETSFLGVVFDHCLFDVRGAEAFLNMDYSQRISLTEPAHLCKWQEKFEAGKRVNRKLVQLSENKSRFLPLHSVVNNQGFKFKIISLDKRQTSAIIETAYNKAGYLMLMPYALAISMEALHSIFLKRGILTGDYIIPVSIDTRPVEKVHQEIFFNHMSFFLLRVKANEADSFSVLLQSIKQQIYDQIKADLPADIEKASLLMRIAPLPVLSYLMRMPLKGQIASFCFSYIGESAYDSPMFMGKKIHNIFHMPRVPIPPGLGIFFNQFQGKLNVVFSYLDEMLEKDEIDSIIHTLRSGLGVLTHTLLEGEAKEEEQNL